MSTRIARWVAWSLAGLAVTLWIVALLLRLTRLPVLGVGGLLFSDPLFAAVFVTFVVVGAMIASRQPTNPIGWLLCGASLAVLADFSHEYAVYGLARRPGSLPAATAASFVGEIGWICAIAVSPFMFLLFPDGRLPSPRWRWVAWASAACGAIYVGGNGLALWPLRGLTLLGKGFEPTGGFLTLGRLGLIGLALAYMAAAISLVGRFRRSRKEERQQLKLVVYAVGLLVMTTLLWVVLDNLGIPSPPSLTSSNSRPGWRSLSRSPSPSCATGSMTLTG